MARQTAAAARANFERAQTLVAGAGSTDDEFDDVPEEASPAPPQAPEPRVEKAPSAGKEPAPPQGSDRGDNVKKRPPRRAATNLDEAKDTDPYGTGVEIPEDLYDKVMNASTARGGKKGDQVRQTEVWLTAFENTFDRLDEIVGEYKRRNQVDSPLFGQRAKRVAESNEAMKRLQIRPRVGEWKTISKLAEEHEIPIAVLTRLVLRTYFDELKPERRRGRKPASEAS